MALTPCPPALRSHAADSTVYDDRVGRGESRGGRGEGGGEHSTLAVEEALRRQMEMQKMLQLQLEVREHADVRL